MWWVAAAWGAELVPVRITEDIRVDGVLDEAIWQELPITGFVEMQPVPGQADRGTRAQIAYDDRMLYLAFHARVDPDRAQSNALSPRDRNRAEDTVGVLLDTFRDGRRAYLFMVNGRGVQGDGIYVEGETSLGFPDLSWDSVFSAAGRFAAGEYQVEMAIPLRSLRFPPGQQQTWNIVLLQHLPVPISDYTWPPIDPNAAGVLVQAATLGPFDVTARQGRVELLPTLTGLLDLATSPVTPEVDPGLAARVDLTTSMVAELTLNPDFSQIESDVGQVSANVKFPLFYPERRPFFLENADLFSTPITLVHTRSIVDPLGGYKLTGRAGPMAIALLGGYDEHPAPSTLSVDYASGEALTVWDESLTEDARAFDQLLRVRGDLGGGDSLGVLMTDKELLTSEGRLGNRVIGVDGQLTAGRYLATVQLLGSQTEYPGSESRLAPAWDTRLFRQGERWVFEVGHAHLGQEFRAENGFLREVGRTTFDGASELLIRPGGAVRLVSPGIGGSLSVNPAGELVYGDAGVGVEANLGTRWTVSSDLAYLHERYAKVDFDLWRHTGSVSVQPASAWFLGVEYSLGTLPHYAAETPADLYRGFDWGVVPSTNADLFGRLNVGAQVAVGVFGPEPLGEPEYVTVIPRVNALLSLTPRWQLRAIEQYDHPSTILQTSGLLGYVLNWGTVGYLGYTEAVPLSGDGPVLRTAFAKVGYLARL
jgi:hypothetical protein